MHVGIQVWNGILVVIMYCTNVVLLLVFEVNYIVTVADFAAF